MSPNQSDKGPTKAQKTAAHMTVDQLIEQANPKPTSDQSTAHGIVAKIKAERDEKRKAEVERRNRAALYYLECRSCQLPAIFFTRDPGVGYTMDHAEWFSELKPAGRPWVGQKIRCQECQAKAPAQYVHGGVKFIPNIRYIRRIDASDDDAKKLIEQMEVLRTTMAPKEVSK